MASSLRLPPAPCSRGLVQLDEPFWGRSAKIPFDVRAPHSLGVVSSTKRMARASAPTPYPQHRVVDVGLRDGSTVRIRPVLPTDLDAVADFFAELSDESIGKRFHGMHRPNLKELKPFVDVDYHHYFSLVAETTIGTEKRIVAVASFVRTGEAQAEMAIAVADSFQGRGVGSILLEHLSEAATDYGIQVFLASILFDNYDMIHVVRDLKLPVVMKSSMGVVEAEFPTAATPEAIEAFENREAVAAVAAVTGFFKPRSVVVIGASRRRGTISGEIFHNLLEVGFEGPVYPVNANADVVQSVPAYKSVADIPGAVDLAVIVVPAAAVVEAARECADKGIRALLIISSGFAETGSEGQALQHALLETARQRGMRIVGPNCLGLVNTDPAIRLNAAFAPVYPLPGRVAFSSQSGALGIAVMARTRDLGLGISSFVSVGNKIDISGNDLIQYWEQDDATDVVLLYLESFGNPRKFARIARRVAKTKPIVAVKSGRSQAGARAAASHTGSIVAGDIAVDALFHQAGVVRTDTLEELFDVASLLAHQPLPDNNRVAILTNAGGLGILCADACEAVGLSVPELAAETAETLRALLPAEASVANPVDMIASATAEQYGESLRLLARDPGIDSIIVIFIPPLVTRAEDVAAALVDVAGAGAGKTVLTCFLGSHGIHEQLIAGRTVIPSFTFPETAARALGKVSHYAAWRAGPEGVIPQFSDIDRTSAAQAAAALLKDGERWLEPVAITRLLDDYGIRSASNRMAGTPEEVEAAAAEIGSTVAVKIDSRSIVHKTDVGGVRLNLTTPKAAAQAAADMLSSLQQKGLADQVEGFLVQEMVTSGGAEMFVGMTLDPLFGPLVACGFGGTMVELLRDVAVRITPLTDLDAGEMLRSLKTWPLFEGYRGQPPLSASALENLLLRVSTLVEDLPHLAEIDLNPVLVSEDDCVVLDSRMKLAAAPPPIPRGARTVPRH